MDKKQEEEEEEMETKIVCRSPLLPAVRHKCQHRNNIKSFLISNPCIGLNSSLVTIQKPNNFDNTNIMHNSCS